MKCEECTSADASIRLPMYAYPRPSASLDAKAPCLNDIPRVTTLNLCVDCYKTRSIASAGERK
jgi:hypothetical protein